MRTLIQLTEAQLAQLLEVSPRRENLLDAVRQPQAPSPSSEKPCSALGVVQDSLKTFP